MEKEIKNIVEKPIILDSHNDTMLRIIDKKTWLPKIDLKENTSFHIDIPKLKKGGINIPFFAAFTEGYGDNIRKSISRTLALINALHFTEEKNPDSFKITSSLESIIHTVNQGKIAAVPTIEGGYSLDEDDSLELLNQYNDLGIKAITLTWNYSNKLGEGAEGVYNDEKKTPSSGGLTELGRKIVLEMNRLGIIVDVSHLNRGTFWDVIEISKSPIIASHSGIDNIKSHNRNLNDKQLKAIADNGGVVGIVFYPGFLSDSEDVYVSDIISHIDYAVNVIGIDHVGLGSDFDGEILPKDLKDSGEIYKIKDGLLERNYSNKDIDKILSGNMLRVLKEVEEKSEDVKKKTSLNINIKPEYKMGEKIKTKMPILMAEVKNKENSGDYKVIVDGVNYKPLYDEVNSKIFLKTEEPLKEKFHIVTFKAEDKKGNIVRETRLFYIEDN